MALTLNDLNTVRYRILSDFLESIGVNLRQLRAETLKEFLTTPDGWAHINAEAFMRTKMLEAIDKAENLTIEAYAKYIDEVQGFVASIKEQGVEFGEARYGFSADPVADYETRLIETMESAFPWEQANVEIDKIVDYYNNYPQGREWTTPKPDWLKNILSEAVEHIAADEVISLRHVMPESWEFRHLMKNAPKIIEFLENGVAEGKFTQEAVDSVFAKMNNFIGSHQVRDAVTGKGAGKYAEILTLQDYKDVYYNRFLPDFFRKSQEFVDGTSDGLRFYINEAMAMSDPYHVFIGFNRLDTPYMQMLEGIGTNILTPEFQRRVAEKGVVYADNPADPLPNRTDIVKINETVKEMRNDFPELDEAMASMRANAGDGVDLDIAANDVRKAVVDIPEVVEEVDNIVRGDSLDTPPNQTQRVSSETGLSTHSDRIRQVAQDYHQIMGYSDPEFKPAMVFNDEIGAAAADIFEQLPMFDDNAIPYYKKFIQETNMQYQVLLDAGIEFELVDTDPYTPNRAGHQQMIADMENGRLKILATEAGFGDEATSRLNPMLAESQYTDVNGRVMLENDVFRAVHDTFGHGMRGNTFGPVGEYNAWLAHKEMYSPDARRVMTTETLGQNTFTNYGPHMRDADGNLLSKADAGYIPPSDRPFASQKVALMPEEIINAAGNVVEDAADLVEYTPVNSVKDFANAEPEVVDGIFKSAKKVVGKAFNTFAGVLDPGDIAITQGIVRLLPRLGVAAISGPALAAYIGYELTVLAIDAAQAIQKAAEKQGIESGPEYVPSFMGGKTLEGNEPMYQDVDWKQFGKDTWSEFGDISDTWSLSWKISEPIIDYAFGEYAKLQENR
tara:strand:+ start:353 stop:2884 length:2532 start_codon:yes stop_codon:yes gene_type:complete